jgi:hypothetical protein
VLDQSPARLHESLEQLQRDRVRYLAFYNRERTHQGYRTQGRTPFQPSSEGLGKMRREEVKPEATYNSSPPEFPVSAHLQLANQNQATIGNHSRSLEIDLQGCIERELKWMDSFLTHGLCASRATSSHPNPHECR